MNAQLRRLLVDPIPIDALVDGEDLSGAVRARAELLHRIMRETDPAWGEPPFDPERVAATLGVPIKDAGILGDLDGMVIPRGNDQFVIVRSKHVRCGGRRVFTTAHELMHLAFSDVRGGVRHRTEDESNDWALRELERLCDLGAAEFVMPAAVFDADVATGGTGAAAIPALADRYAVSLEAAGLRLLQRTQPRVAGVGFFEYGVRPSLRRRRGDAPASRDTQGGAETRPSRAAADKAGKPLGREHADSAKSTQHRDADSRLPRRSRPGDALPQYRARRVFMAPGLPFLFPTGKSVPSESCIHRASTRRRELNAEETFALGETQVTLKVSAFPLTEELHPTEPPMVCAVFSR